jgi:hypothetical protein
MWITAAVQ